jgi:hypothetical protein
VLVTVDADDGIVRRLVDAAAFELLSHETAAAARDALDATRCSSSNPRKEASIIA